MRKICLALLALCCLSTQARAADTGNLAAGKTVYLHQCSDCHSNQPHVDRFGPTLAGVYGRMSGTAPLHRYSKAMESAHIVWNATTLNDFLKNPRSYIHGTIMPYSGLASATARADVIVYLQSISPKS
jgi:cytochrome c